MIIQFLDALPQSFANTTDVNSATGAAMQCARNLIVSYFVLSSPFGLIQILRKCYQNRRRYIKDKKEVRPSDMRHLPTNPQDS